MPSPIRISAPCGGTYSSSRRAGALFFIHLQSRKLVVDDVSPTWQPLPKPTVPKSTADCKNGGYEEFGFKNQGQCKAIVNGAASNR
jgi:hypothetical protein